MPFPRSRSLRTGYPAFPFRVIAPGSIRSSQGEVTLSNAFISDKS